MSRQFKVDHQYAQLLLAWKRANRKGRLDADEVKKLVEAGALQGDLEHWMDVLEGNGNDIKGPVGHSHFALDTPRHWNAFSPWGNSEKHSEATPLSFLYKGTHIQPLGEAVFDPSNFEDSKISLNRSQTLFQAPTRVELPLLSDEKVVSHLKNQGLYPWNPKPEDKESYFQKSKDALTSLLSLAREQE